MQFYTEFNEKSFFICYMCSFYFSTENYRFTEKCVFCQEYRDRAVLPYLWTLYMEGIDPMSHRVCIGYVCYFKGRIVESVPRGFYICCYIFSMILLVHKNKILSFEL